MDAMNIIELGAESTTVSGGDSSIELALGYVRTARECFRSDPPTDADFERAINVIEDELERAVRIVERGAAEVRTEPGLARLLARTDVESQYQQLVARGSADGDAYAAAVVILREMTHHLGITPRFRV